MTDLGRTETQLRVRYAATEGIESALKDSGHAIVTDVFGAYEATQMHYEAERVLPFMRREVPSWHNTRRATFVPLGAIGLKNLKYLPVCAEAWLPNASALVAETAEHVRHAGSRLGIEPLAVWRPTRIGVNYMDGSTYNKAAIPEHTDPETLSGLVLAFTIAGVGETNDESNALGSMHLFMGDDVCSEAGIPQPLHRVEADNYRISVTAANLRTS